MPEPRIITNPKILFGKPVIAGTRISVELILEELGAGTSIEGILEAYPHLTREQVLAAVQFAAYAIRTDAVYPFETVPT